MSFQMRKTVFDYRGKNSATYWMQAYAPLGTSSSQHYSYGALRSWRLCRSWRQARGGPRLTYLNRHLSPRLPDFGNASLRMIGPVCFHRALSPSAGFSFSVIQYWPSEQASIPMLSATPCPVRRVKGPPKNTLHIWMTPRPHQLGVLESRQYQQVLTASDSLIWQRLHAPKRTTCFQTGPE